MSTIIEHSGRQNRSVTNAKNALFFNPNGTYTNDEKERLTGLLAKKVEAERGKPVSLQHIRGGTRRTRRTRHTRHTRHTRSKRSKRITRRK